MWQALIPIATTLMGMDSASKKQAQQERYNKAQAEQTRYSPWSGMGAGQLDKSYAPGALEGGVAGGLQGLGMWQSLSGLGLGKSATAGNPTMSSGLDSSVVDQQASPWEAFSGKKYNTFQRTS